MFESEKFDQVSSSIIVDFEKQRPDDFGENLTLQDGSLIFQKRSLSLMSATYTGACSGRVECTGRIWTQNPSICS